MELVKANIPYDYWCLSLGTLELVEDRYTRLIEHYIDRIDGAFSKAMGIVMFGSNGIGKTSMMCEIGKAGIVRGYTVRYFTAQQLVDCMKDDTKAVEKYYNADVLLVDELDKVYIKRGSSYVTKSVEDFLRKSISSGKTVIMCTNYDDDDMSKVFGDSVISMLKRHSKFLEIEGEDYSDVLHDSWVDQLDSEMDYYCEAIVGMADQLQEYTENQENESWKQYRRESK